MEKIDQLLITKKEIENELEELNLKISSDNNNKMKWIKCKRLCDLEFKKNNKEIEVEKIKKEIELLKKSN